MIIPTLLRRRKCESSFFQESVYLNGNTIPFEHMAAIRKLSLDNIGIDLSSKLEIFWK
jgi:hypothetical protein